jgi:ribosomal subunit interface protein
MQNPLQVTFRNMEPSEAMEADVREKAAKLDEFYDQIMSCRVVVEAHHHSHHKGNLYHVRIHITVPGEKEIVVSREPMDKHAHEDAYIAIRDAFDAARRQLQDHAREIRQDVKQHEAVPHGRISKLVPEEDYGRIEGSDGSNIYFHRNSVVNADFDTLEEGMEVRFAVEQGDAGPQASSVQLIGKHHIVG